MDHTGPYGTIWDHMGPYGTIRDHTGQYWTIRDHTGPYRTILDHTGPYDFDTFPKYLKLKNDKLGLSCAKLRPASLLRLLLLENLELYKGVQAGAELGSVQAETVRLQVQV